MRRSLCIALAFSLAQAPVSLAQITTDVVFITVPSDTATVERQAVATAETSSSNAPNSTPTPSTLATMVTSSQSIAQTTDTSSPQATDGGSEYDGSTGGGGAVDTDAGASGSQEGSFNISKGGLAAIVVVIALVVLFGVASTVLFVIAKRRQWTMRETLRRASRRLTGRTNAPRTPLTADRQSRRAGLRMDSPPRAGAKADYAPGHKRGLVVGVRDVEKGPGPLDGKAPKNTKPREATWVKNIWGNGWK